ncbi:gamma-glutamyl-gamma-aminobutyrate hydrolase family protein [Jannaschia sp. Os4]|uniref:gamma-glutamyl-gamma-aminobutyrate hydrolase family protein n=1 Tax=Jannaschia sp. Os4 TaxID=2807617 RepID=UPI00193AB83D|nr:gamma-glutamyl-gamma-aminobutyrate hydrolase family protein [Jannaschia sp. Os4]MBM2576957.1 gamma-glutamyl-gamma-aminobutyrate hydrolase family protein [Jannaschia sp. Os4]
MRARVGIISNHYLINDQYPAHANGSMNTDAVNDVSDCMALTFPADPRVTRIDELLDTFDGFLFTGGRPNVHPEEYGEVATEAHGAFDRDRDRVALPLIRAAVERGQPILGICRGFQEVAVAFGSTLHPEIRDLPGRMNHRMPPDGTLEEKFALRHDVRLAPGSAYAALFGGEVVRTNTLHGQGIKVAGPRVRIDGWAEDDTPEAISIAGAAGFALAVQWHPEANAADDPVSRPLFAAFGDACREWRAGGARRAA